jgi:hypothetical protein
LNALPTDRRDNEQTTMMARQPQPIHLIAHDPDDLIVMSALLQDALVRHADMTYESKRHRFVLVLSRFRWEAGPTARERVRAGLHFNHVLKVQHQKLALAKADSVAELLAIRCATDGAGGTEITLELAGGGAIRLVAECLDAEVRDLGPAWRADHTPDHTESR